MAMRRRPGRGRFKQDQERREIMAEKGKELKEREMKQMQEHMGTFQEKLAEFASKHRREINEDPVFRREFHRMTREVGVDPLASNRGFWGEVLGVGDFYFELGVQILDVCISTRPLNGGLIEMGDLMRRLEALRGTGRQVRERALAISPDDVEQAIRKLRILGRGFSIRKTRDRVYVVSVPYELNDDNTDALTEADKSGGCVSARDLAANLRWPMERSEQALMSLVAEGMAWVDDGAEDGVRRFWVPSLALKDGRPQAGVRAGAG